MENMENTNQENVVENQENTTTEKKEIDYDKIQEIVSKATEQKEKAVVNSFLQQMGMNEEEAKVAFNQYKENKARQEEEKKNNVKELLKENDLLKKSLNTEKVNNAINLEAFALGLDSKAVKAITKLGNFDDVLTNGVIDNEKIKSSINSVLDEYPGFKSVSTSSNSKIVEVGAPSGNKDEDSSMDELRKAFGLKPKKIK